jgi:general secretion pathway protein K
VKEKFSKKPSTLHRQLSTANQRGSALVVTLLIVTLLISLVVEFAYEVYIDTAAISNWSNAQRASLIAKSGQTLSSTFLREINNLTYMYPGEFYLPVEKDFGPGSSLFIKVADESGKFNINSLIHQNNFDNGDAFLVLERLFEHLDIDPSLVKTIADWIDPDHESRLKNSEFNAKNSYILDIKELKLINRIDKNIYETISPFITVHGNFGIMNDININTAQLPMLISQLGISEIIAQRIIDYRDTTPFKIKEDIKKVSGIDENFYMTRYDKFTVDSSLLRVRSTARVNEITRVIESVMDDSLNIKYWREI